MQTFIARENFERYSKLLEHESDLVKRQLLEDLLADEKTKLCGGDGARIVPSSTPNDEAPLSVISALARLDAHPWEEAAALARLPSETAAQRLASLLRRLPYGPSVRPDPRMIADRLVALLPQRAKPETPSRGILFHTGPLNGSQLFAGYAWSTWLRS